MSKCPECNKELPFFYGVKNCLDHMDMFELREYAKGKAECLTQIFKDNAEYIKRAEKFKCEVQSKLDKVVTENAVQRFLKIADLRTRLDKVTARRRELVMRYKGRIKFYKEEKEHWLNMCADQASTIEALKDANKALIDHGNRLIANSLLIKGA